MHSNSGHVKCTPYTNANDVIDITSSDFKWLCWIYQENLETSMKGSDFIFDSVQLLYCKCHKVNFSRGSSSIDSPDWIKKKKATINPRNINKIFSICSNCCIKLWKKWITSKKSFKYLTIHK